MHLGISAWFSDIGRYYVQSDYRFPGRLFQQVVLLFI